MAALASDAPRLRCGLIEAEPEQALPALALGDVDLVLGDEWQHHPWRLPVGLRRDHQLRDRRARPAARPPGAGAPPDGPPAGAGAPRLPDLVVPRRHPGIALRAIAEHPLSRAIFVVTRAADAARPSTQALLAVVRAAAAALP